MILSSISLGAQNKGSAPQPPASAAAALAAAIQAVGGEERLTSVRAIKVDTIGHEFALEQSERPEGPWLANYVQRTELRDSAGQRLHRQTQTRNWGAPKWSPATPAMTIVSNKTVTHKVGQRWRAGTGAELIEAENAFALSPERMLLTARAASDLKSGPVRTLQGVAHHSVTFTWNTSPVTLFFNSWTHYPTLLEIIRQDSWGVWGDVTERRWYSWWELQKGLWYPKLLTVEWNGFPLREISTMEFVVDPPVNEADFEIAADIVAAFAAAKDRKTGVPTLTLDTSKALDITPEVVLLQGNWNVLLVRQPDGVVVIEGPISSSYSREVIAAVEKRFPGAAVKAVVTTSDAWPHIGGIREYVARRIPVYALDLNVSLLDRLVKSTRTIAPDTLSANPVVPSWKTVAGLTTIGSGELRVQLLPVRGETGERMMLALLPGIQLAYSSDLIQYQRPKGFFMPAMIAEVVAAFERENVGQPKQVVGMHLPPTPWAEIVEALEALRAR